MASRIIYLDTHVLVWLYADPTLLSPPARQAVEESQLLCSPAAILELEYLFETRRINVRALTVLQYLAPRLELAQCDLPFSDVVRTALDENWTRDPFDRLITAQARLRNVAILSKDKYIQANYHQAFW
ncbi:MAG: PIN domain-containing protein [Spirochaetales bacterium]|nr:PIN domain-containing protein [Spirochaetales bacterium]